MFSKEIEDLFEIVFGVDRKIQYQGKKIFVSELPPQVWCRINRVILRKK